jgi:hypothetical protein
MNLTRRDQLLEKLLRAIVQAQGGTATVDLSRLTPNEVLVARRVEGDTWELQIRSRLDGIKELQAASSPRLYLLDGKRLEQAI